MQGITFPVLQPIIILATILTQRFNASLTPIAIDPSASEHATSNINAIQNIGLWHGNRLNTERRQRLETRLATAELPYLDVVREVVVPVLPAVLNALVVQNLGIVTEADA